MKFVGTRLLLLLFLLLPAGVVAAVEGEGPPLKTLQSYRSDEEQTGGVAQWYARFQPYMMNYVIGQRTEGDDDSVEVQYSFKYNLFNRQKASLHNVYLSFTGKFDFYMWTRDSSPVINRTSNPAVHYRVGRTIENHALWVDFGFEHRSNGQVTDAGARDDNPASPTYGRFLTQIELDKGNREYFDGISRSANYLSITPGWRRNSVNRAGEEYDRERVELGVKLYGSEESRITWGRDADRGLDFGDYDLVRLLVSHTQPFDFDWLREVTARCEYVIGAKGLATDSVDLYLVVPLYLDSGKWKIPLMAKAHFGPMDRLANYTESLRSFGVGLALAY